MVKTHQVVIEMLTKLVANTFEAQKKLVDDSDHKIVELQVKVDQAVLEVKDMYLNMKKFTKSFQSSSNNNVSEVNKVIEGFCLSLQTEKESLSSLCFGLQKDNTNHHTSIANSILRMQNELAHETKVMDALAGSTQKVKVLKEQLKNAFIEL